MPYIIIDKHLGYVKLPNGKWKLVSFDNDNATYHTLEKKESASLDRAYLQTNNK